MIAPRDTLKNVIRGRTETHHHLESCESWSSRITFATGVFVREGETLANYSTKNRGSKGRKVVIYLAAFGKEAQEGEAQKSKSSKPRLVLIDQLEGRESQLSHHSIQQLASKGGGGENREKT